MKITTLGLDIAKSVFHVFAVNKMGTLVKKKQLKRKELLAFVAQLDPCRVAMEACGGAHHWAREFTKLGHEVKLIAPQYVKPYVKGNKNDYNDAEAIAEAAQRPNMRFVPIKTQEQHDGMDAGGRAMHGAIAEDIQALHRLRERTVKERTALANQIRGLLSEYGIVIRLGMTAVRKALPEILEDGENGLTPRGRACFTHLRDELVETDATCARYEHDSHRIDFMRGGEQIVQVNQEHEVCRRLDEVMGIGPITATATSATAPALPYLRHPCRRMRRREPPRSFTTADTFPRGWGWCPNNTPAAAKTRCLGSASVATRICAPCLFTARAVLRYAATKEDRFSRWANALHARRGHNRACVAVANKLARIAWVILAKGESYRPAV